MRIEGIAPNNRRLSRTAKRQQRARAASRWLSAHQRAYSHSSQLRHTLIRVAVVQMREAGDRGPHRAWLAGASSGLQICIAYTEFLCGQVFKRSMKKYLQWIPDFAIVAGASTSVMNHTLLRYSASKVS